MKSTNNNPPILTHTSIYIYYSWYIYDGNIMGISYLQYNIRSKDGNMLGVYREYNGKVMGVYDGHSSCLTEL